MYPFVCVFDNVYDFAHVTVCVGWWFVNVDDFNEGWVPATYLEPLYGSEDISVQRLDPGEGNAHTQ